MAGDGDRLYARQAQPLIQASITSLANNYVQALNTLFSPGNLLYVQALAIPLAFWFKPFCVCLALFWLTYRAAHVLNKPLDELAVLLGFDIPVVPSLAIAGLKADGAIVHWSLPEKQRGKSAYKYEIHVNGSIVGSTSMHEEAAIVSGLQPNKFYIVRVALVHQEFSTKSGPLRFRTKAAASNDFFHQPDLQGSESESVVSPLVRIQPYRGLKDVSAVPAAQAAVVQASSAIARKRSNTNWRSAITGSAADSRAESVQQQEDGGEVIGHLTERLDQLRREHDEAERAAKEEEEEEQKQREDLVRERDELRAELAEREKISRNLKREVNAMERQNTLAQNERSKLERLLQQRLNERTKFKDDAVRWAREAVTMTAQAEQIEKDRLAYLERAAEDKLALEERLASEHTLVKNLDDDIKETAAEIKKMERGTKNASPSSIDAQVSLVEQFQHDAEEDRQHNLRKYDLQNQYASAVQKLEQAKRFYLNNMQYLEGLRERRQREEAAAAANASTRDLTSNIERMPMRKDSSGSRRNGSGHHDSPRLATFSPVSQPFGAASTAPAFTSNSIFSFGNVMSSAGADTNNNDDYRDRLTGGALLSPEAGAGLLPADLFAADDRIAEVQPLPGLGALPGVTQLPGLGQPADHNDAGPASPSSIASRPASTFASPQASQQHLPFHFSSPDPFPDSDGRSIRSNRSGINAANANTGSRFSAMFGLRQKAKQSSLDDSTSGAPLGRFNSRSMPRQDQGLIRLGSASRKRNSSLSGNVFNAFDAEDDKSPTDAPAQPRRRPFNLNPFSKDKSADGWPSSFSPFSKRPVSPRPLSTHSGELPRPSFDSSRWGVDTWQAGEGSTAARASPLSLGSWSIPGNQSRTFGSRHASRRPSAQHGMSGAPDDILEDDDDQDSVNGKQPLAPIGTKPQAIAKSKQDDVKLNPNAKDFKSFLSSMRLRDRDKSKGAADGSSSKATTPLAEGQPFSGDHDSPTHSRASRDGRSLTTLESSSESRRQSTELVLSPTYSNSEAAASPQMPGSASGRESFMQKITRKKSSSSKFSLPTFKRDGKPRLDREASVTASPSIPHVEDDEDDLSMSVSSSKDPRESVDRGRGAAARSWSSVLKIGKKKAGTETPSVSELSMASEAEETDDA